MFISIPLSAIQYNRVAYATRVVYATELLSPPHPNHERGSFCGSGERSHHRKELEHNEVAKRPQEVAPTTTPSSWGHHQMRLDELGVPPLYGGGKRSRCILFSKFIRSTQSRSLRHPRHYCHGSAL